MSQRPLLPILEPHRVALEKCVYCPKLSRAVCPVANVESSETVTPWGKMSLAYFVGRGDLNATKEVAGASWACSACYACREHCEHHNEVAAALLDNRAEMFSRGLAPEGATCVSQGYSDREREQQKILDSIAPEANHDATVGLLIGCSYVRHQRSTAEAALRLTRRWLGKPVRVLRRCCGLSLKYAGDRHGFERAARNFASDLGSVDEIVVADPGCAHTLIELYGELLEGRTVRPLIDVAFAKLDDIPALALKGRVLRYHDPCQLGRGLGRYEEPRAVLARLTGEAPLEFQRHRRDAECSGGGGLLSVTRPETAAAMASSRLEEHQDDPDAVLVTGCGESLRRFSKSASGVTDWINLVDESMRQGGDGG